jgi:hydroxymethylbilane synthase
MSSRNSFVIGARSSRLSLIQANTVLAALTAAHPEARFVLREFTTTGDRLLDTPLPLLGGKGVFTDEIESALLSEEIDFAVHSLKDLPVEQRAGLTVGAVPVRESVADVLIGRTAPTLEALPVRAHVGTSSLRRAAQLRRSRPDLDPISIRGNVETRLRKLDDPAHGFDAIVLARAGLDRLGLLDRATQELPVAEFLPAPGQGALAVQCRDDAASLDLAASIGDMATTLAVAAERSFLSSLGGGCSTPVGALGEVEQGRIRLMGRVVALDGSRSVDVSLEDDCPSVEAALAAGRDLARQAMALGAEKLLGVPS